MPSRSMPLAGVALSIVAAACVSTPEPLAVEEPATTVQAETAATIQEDSTAVERSSESHSEGFLNPERLSALVALSTEEASLWGVYGPGIESNYSIPWVTPPGSEEGRLLFESEVGVASDSIDAVARFASESGWLVVASSSGSSDDALARVLTDSPWADLATVETVGEFSLVSFGDSNKFDRRSVIRPIGQPGEMAFGDGLILWSPEIGEVRAMIEATPTMEFIDAAQVVGATSGWQQIEIFPARSVDFVLSDWCSYCDSSQQARMREEFTVAGNLGRFTSSAVVSLAEPDEYEILLMHDSIDDALQNASRIEEIHASTFDRWLGESLADQLELVAVELEGNVVVIRVVERKPGTAGTLWLSPMLTWDEVAA